MVLVLACKQEPDEHYGTNKSAPISEEVIEEDDEHKDRIETLCKYQLSDLSHSQTWLASAFLSLSFLNKAQPDLVFSDLGLA